MTTSWMASFPLCTRTCRPAPCRRRGKRPIPPPGRCSTWNGFRRSFRCVWNIARICRPPTTRVGYAYDDPLFVDVHSCWRGAGAYLSVRNAERPSLLYTFRATSSRASVPDTINYATPTQRREFWGHIPAYKGVTHQITLSDYFIELIALKFVCKGLQWENIQAR